MRPLGVTRMQTLHEYMQVTKATEYILSAGFLILFVAYWSFVFGRPRSDRSARHGDKGHV
jgi:hypothetical protein